MHEQHQLLQEINTQAEADHACGRRNHMTELVCSFGAILFSFIAAIAAAALTRDKSVGIVIATTAAALPGLFVSLQRVIDFRGRAAWYFQKSAMLGSLALALKYEGLSVEEAARQFGTLEVEMEKRWSEFVKAGTAAPQK